MGALYLCRKVGGKGWFDMTQHKEIQKDFFRYVSLNILGMIGLSCYILADTYFVANGLGANGLAALNLAIPVYNFINGLGLMIGMGAATRYSILKGTATRRETDGIFSQAVIFALGIALILMLIGLFFARPLGTLLGADETVIDMTAPYLQVLLLFSPMFLMNNLILCFVRNDGAPRLAMAGMLIGSLSNIVLDYVFIFPCGMGMFGAALATGTAPVVSLAIQSSHFFRKRNHFRFRLCRPSFRAFGDISSLGAPSLITEVSSGVVMIFFNMVILSLSGNIGVAAYGVVANLALVVLSIFTGISQGIQPLVSRNYGAQDAAAVKKVYRYAITTALVLAAGVYVVLFLFAPQAVSLFNGENNQQLAAIAEPGIRLYFIGFLFAGFNVVTAVTFSSVDRPRQSFLLSILRGFVLIIPLIFLLTALLGMTGVWLAFPVCEFLTAGVALVFWLQYGRNLLQGAEDSTHG